MAPVLSKIASKTNSESCNGRVKTIRQPTVDLSILKTYEIIEWRLYLLPDNHIVLGAESYHPSLPYVRKFRHTSRLADILFYSEQGAFNKEDPRRDVFYELEQCYTEWTKSINGIESYVYIPKLGSREWKVNDYVRWAEKFVEWTNKYSKKCKLWSESTTSIYGGLALKSTVDELLNSYTAARMFLDKYDNENSMTLTHFYKFTSTTRLGQYFKNPPEGQRAVLKQWLCRRRYSTEWGDLFTDFRIDESFGRKTKDDMFDSSSEFSIDEENSDLTRRSVSNLSSDCSSDKTCESLSFECADSFSDSSADNEGSLFDNYSENDCESMETTVNNLFCSSNV